MSVRIGKPVSSLIVFNTRKPSGIPLPRKLLMDERFALSYEALKIYGNLSEPVIDLIARAIFMACSSLSTTHGPPIKNNSPPPRVISPTENLVLESDILLILSVSYDQHRGAKQLLYTNHRPRRQACAKKRRTAAKSLRLSSLPRL